MIRLVSILVCAIIASGAAVADTAGPDDYPVCQCPFLIDQSTQTQPRGQTMFDEVVRNVSMLIDGGHASSITFLPPDGGGGGWNITSPVPLPAAGGLLGVASLTF